MSLQKQIKRFHRVNSSDELNESVNIAAHLILFKLKLSLICYRPILSSSLCTVLRGQYAQLTMFTELRLIREVL